MPGLLHESNAGNTSNKLKKEIIFKEIPSQLEITLSEQCNMNCDYCFMNKSLVGVLSQKDAEYGVNTFLKLPGETKTITFNSGEPTLYFKTIQDIYATIKAHKPCGITCLLTTNASCVTVAQYQFLRKNKFVVNIGIDGKEESQNKHRRFKAGNLSTSKQVEKNLNNISTKDTRAIMTVNKDTIAYLSENVKYLLQKGFCKFDIYPHMFEVYSKNQIQELKKQLYGVVRILQHFELKTKATIDMKWLNRVWLSTCYNKILLSPDNNFYLFDSVTVLPYTARKKYRIGDIKKGINLEKRITLFIALITQAEYEFPRIASYCRKSSNLYFPLPLYIWCKNNNKSFNSHFQSYKEIAEMYFELCSQWEQRAKPNNCEDKIAGRI